MADCRAVADAVGADCLDVLDRQMGRLARWDEDGARLGVWGGYRNLRDLRNRGGGEVPRT